MFHKVIHIILGLFFSCPIVFAQVSIDRTLISPFGSYKATPNLKISDSAGETLVSSYISGNFSLAEGFQQVLENEITGIEDFSSLIEYQIYPNPVFKELNVNFTLFKGSEAVIEIFDIKGSNLPSLKRHLIGSGKLSSLISFNELPMGIYLLQIRNKKGSLLASHKIQKLN